MFLETVSEPGDLALLSVLFRVNPRDTAFMKKATDFVQSGVKGVNKVVFK